MRIAADLRYRIAVLGSPSQPDVSWTADNLRRLLAIGFNAVQLNIAWGSRPADEPLNLEDLFPQTDLSTDQLTAGGHGPDPTPEDLARRRSDLASRIALCHDTGIRSIFHFGAPYNGGFGYDDRPLSQCLLNPATQRRYVELVGRLP